MNREESAPYDRIWKARARFTENKYIFKNIIINAELQMKYLFSWSSNYAVY